MKLVKKRQLKDFNAAKGAPHLRRRDFNDRTCAIASSNVYRDRWGNMDPNIFLCTLVLFSSYYLWL